MTERELLRQLVATIAYRGGKVVRDAPEGFGSFRAGEGSRRAGRILAHVGDLFDWAVALADGESRWSDTREHDWEAQVERFWSGLAALDRRLASEEPLGGPAARLISGPRADALAHVGQLAMLRRLAGAPVKGENYYVAEVEIGRVGPDQNPPVFEFG